MSEDERRGRTVPPARGSRDAGAGPDASDVPPSFAPRSVPPRPSGEGARRVGAGADATRAMPAAGPDGRPAGSPRAATPGQDELRASPAAGPDRGPGTRSAGSTDARAARPRDADRIPPAYAPRGSGSADGYGTPGQWSAAPPPGPPPSEFPPGSPAPGGRHPRRRRRGRTAGRVLLVLLVLLLAWPVGLLVWANSRLDHVEALSDAPGTPGTTYLLAGSDSRADGTVPDGTDGERADTIMVLHEPASGPTALISLPRDTYTEIPGHGANKLNAAYSLGGPPLLVRSVEELTGLTVDHYVEIGMGGVETVVDAVGGVELCLDYDVDDPRSELVWEAGCRVADGPTALAFARMRYADPDGDLGRAARQRQVVSTVVAKAAEPATLANPVRLVQLVGAGTDALVVDTGTGIVDLGRMALAFRAATGADGVLGAPPIAMLDYRPGGDVGSTVLLDPDLAPGFFERLRAGTLTAEDVE